jgi:undecaprenyl diphosphate synthase
VLCDAIEASERATSGGTVLDLRLAVDYSARDAIVRAAALVRPEASLTREGFARALAQSGANGAGERGEAGGTPEVDLLIRTGGERRLSDFMLWECAYAELLFTRRMWPEFRAADLATAVESFRKRERRFGRVPDRAAS